ncbi:hypothetical protein RJ641_000580 [Dillenia turbinata]|uniref:Ubiquinone biosynthesis O-methyltransferase, mitochondrial n=1 Tax=Dillenia turbinata TaxID=194707 RepID=A0AAN8WEX0_9MAGN
MMASKLLNQCRKFFPNPNSGRLLPYFALPRFYFDVPESVPVQPPPLHPQENPLSPSTSKIDGDKNAFKASLKLSSSLKQDELAKFAAIAETCSSLVFTYWWDAEGPFKPLHVMNPTRLTFIRSTLCRHFGKDPSSPRPFEGLKIIDVGCGGGILSEPLARMGAMVTGVDAVEKNIKIASFHAEMDPMTSTIEYCCTTAGELPKEGEGYYHVSRDITTITICPSWYNYLFGNIWAEKLVEEQRQFDAVIALEVIEHVADPAEFCKSLAALTVTGGATVISTVNRTMRSYASAIVAAEYILHWITYAVLQLPKGTHQWSSFLTPEELVLILQRASISVQEMAGFIYNPLTGRWALSTDTSVNFIAFGTKNSQ